MSIFTVTLDAKSEVARGFSINTKLDVLSKLSESEIIAEAHKSKVIKLQIPLRKCNDALEMQDYLRKNGYPDAEVKDGIVKEVSVKTKISKEFNALASVVGEDEAMKIVEKAIADAQVAAQ